MSLKFSVNIICPTNIKVSNWISIKIGKIFIYLLLNFYQKKIKTILKPLNSKFQI